MRCGVNWGVTLRSLLPILLVGCVEAAARPPTTVAMRGPAAVEEAKKPAVDSLSWARKAGEVVDSVDVPVRGDQKAHVIVFVRRKGGVRPYLRGKDDALVPVAGWPVAVELKRVFLHEGRAYAEVESKAIFDQPAGLRGFVDIESPSDEHASGALAEEAARWLGAASSIEFKEREVETEAAGAAVKALRTSSGHVDPKGVDVWRMHQGVFLERTAHYAPNDPALGPLLRGLTDAPYCDVCYDAGNVAVLNKDASLTLRGIVMQAALPAKPKSGTAALVSASPTTTATAAALAALDLDGEVVAQAPFERGDASSSLGFAMVTLGDRRTPVAVIREHGEVLLARLDEIANTTYDGQDNERLAARFVDVDGDGRPELLVERVVARDGVDLSFRQLYRVDMTMTTAYRGLVSASSDVSRSYAVHMAASLDEAARAARDHVSANVKATDICEIVKSLETLKGLKRTLPRDGVVLQFEEPGFPMFGATKMPISKIQSWNPNFLVDPSTPTCENFGCDGDSYCSAQFGPGSTHLWFERRKGKLVLVGIADYVGS